MTELNWPLSADWESPDLDRAVICHKRLTLAEVRRLPADTLKRVFREADKYAKIAMRAGLPVTAEEWTLQGREG